MNLSMHKTTFTCVITFLFVINFLSCLTAQEKKTSQKPYWEPLIQKLPATIDQLKEQLAQIPASFKLKKDSKDPLSIYEKLQTHIAESQKIIQILEKQNLDDAQKAELNEISKEINIRSEPILYNYLEALFKSIPADLRGLKKEQITLIKKRVVQGIKVSVSFFKMYPKSPMLNKCHFFLADFLFLNSNVALSGLVDQWKRAHNGKRPSSPQVTAWKEKYFQQIFDLLKLVLPAEKLPNWIKEKALKLNADALSDMHKRKEAAIAYTKYLEKWPDSSFAKSGIIYINIAQNYLYNITPEPAVKILRKGVKKCADSKYYPYLVNVLFKALKATGRLEEAKDLWIKNGPIFEKLAKDKSLDSFTRNGYKTYSEWSLFRIGYMNFALLKYEKAKESFKNHIQYLKKMEESGIALGPATTVYLQRSTDLLKLLQNHIMAPAPQLPTEENWAFKHKFSIDDNSMKVIAIMFRSYESKRSQPAMKFLQEQYESYGFDSGPLAVASISFSKGNVDIPGQVKQLEEESHELGITFPMGLDPSKKFDIFKQYGVNIGSATLVFIDPLGRIAYYEQDPMPNAFGLFKRVIKGLLKG